jgi:hypothetical protein
MVARDAILERFGATVERNLDMVHAVLARLHEVNHAQCTRRT